MISDISHIVFKDVRKSYDGKTIIVDDLNLEVKKGEFLSLLGPSGSGKTTCLMMLAGFETVTSGDILIDDTPVQNIPPNKRNIGMVFQNYALFPHMTVFENLAFPLEIRKMPKDAIKQQVEKILSIVRLEAFASRRISQLSGGQQQRVAVARAITFEPQIVLMDEPLGALDKNLREEMQFEIKHLHERLGITIVYVTHDQSEAITMSDRVAVFNDGKIQQHSSPEVLYEKPENIFVANFIGENNNIMGELKGREGDMATVAVKDTILTGNCTSTVGEGKSVIISIRPEKVVIDSENDQANNNNIQGVVEEAIYMGDHTRLRINVLGNDEFIVKILNNQLKTHYHAGDTLKLSWNTQHCCVLDA